MDDMTAKFAKAILARRKALGLTQGELAERVGTSKQMVSKYENMQRSPKVVMANAFAEALGTTLDELLGVEKANDILMTDYDKPKNDDIYTIYKWLCKMSPEQVKQTKDVIKMMFANYPDIFTEIKDDDNNEEDNYPFSSIIMDQNFMYEEMRHD